MTELNAGTHALVLSGGGGYAAYEVGVLRALASGASPACGGEPVDPQIVTGTSAGALNAAFVVSRDAVPFPRIVDELDRLWRERIARGGRDCDNGLFRYRGDLGAFFREGCWQDDPAMLAERFAEDAVFFAQDWSERLMTFVTAPGDLRSRALGLIDISSFFDSDQMSRTVEAAIDFAAIRAATRALTVIATNWDTGRLREFHNRDFTDAHGARCIIASGALPGIFPPVRIDGDLHVDGGALMNTPLKPAIDAGAGTIHVIYMDPHLGRIPERALRNTMETLDRLLVIQRAALLNLDIEQAERINRGLELLEHDAPSPSRRGDLVTLAGRIGQRRDESAGFRDEEPRATLGYRQLTIHRYHPHEDLGGFIGALRLEQDAIADLIDKGFDDAIHHQCDACGCVVPSGVKAEVRSQ